MLPRGCISSSAIRMRTCTLTQQVASATCGCAFRCSARGHTSVPQPYGGMPPARCAFRLPARQSSPLDPNPNPCGQAPERRPSLTSDSLRGEGAPPGSRGLGAAL